MSSPKKTLLDKYNRLLETEAEKDRLRPPRLVTLVADREWIKAVAARSAALDEFVAAARQTCEAWQKPKAKSAAGTASRDLSAET
ncbi:hypothetical protein [Microvirga massiliensis]|uniref:hypothetical protein n=1 Tax=Microvirga massiliensis TaxID=1033741 RepID=UPI00062B8D54|nr:hypothetical protein [Microvirga massiliensis]